VIVVPNGPDADIVTQVDHAVISGALAAAWSVPLRSSLVTAARLHDVGWEDWERRPQPNPETGRPCNFLDVDVTEHLRFYRAGIEAVLAVDRSAGLLVSKHAAGIYTGRYGTQMALKLSRAPEVQGLVDAFVAEQEALHDGLVDWAEYVLLQVFDRLSLWLCRGDPAGQGRLEIVLPADETLVVEPTPAGARLDPFPFAGDRLDVSVPTRTMPLDGWTDAATLTAAFLAAPVQARPAVLTR
jgi:Protein of unknown function (DUF3891)